MNKFRKDLYQIGVVISLAFVPLVIGVVSIFLAKILGCKLTARGGESCQFLGMDVGGVLYSGSLMSMGTIIALPVVGILVTGLLVVRMMQKISRSKAESEKDGE
jgi:hypothetical protein